MPWIEVGRMKVYTTVTDDGILSELAESALTRELEYAQAAYEAGSREAAKVAVRVLREYRRAHSRPEWPKWVEDAVSQELERDPDEPSGMGRHARTKTRRRDDIVDYYRALAVNDFLDQGLKVTHAYLAASQCLRGDAGGSEKVMAQSYKRFYERLSKEPARYFPFTAPSLGNKPPNFTSQNFSKTRPSVA